MGNNKGSNIFLGVIGVATLLVAIIGATFAFFGANSGSSEGAVSAQSAIINLGYEDKTGGLKTNLIPAEYWIAEYAAREQFLLNQTALNKWKEENPDKFYTVDGLESGKAKNFQCMDDNGNEVCGVYEFTIGNPSFTTVQTVYGSIKVVTPDMKDVWFRIYDEEGTQVVAPTSFDSAVNSVIELPTLTQRLLPSSSDSGKTPDKDGDSFTQAEPSSYTLVEETNNGKKEYNKRTYTLVLWIEETQTNQTETSGGGKMFAASVNFTSASGTSGVSGVIAGALQGENPDNPDGSSYPKPEVPEADPDEGQENGA